MIEGISFTHSMRRWLRHGAIEPSAFRALREQGLGVIDVGARGGAHPVFNIVNLMVELVGFEPDPEEAKRLQMSGQGNRRFKSLTYLPCALGSMDGQQTFHVCRSSGVSSLYQPNSGFLERFPDARRFQVESTAPIAVRSLDSLRRDRSVKLPQHIDFIKIDTQGSELDILKGAQATLRGEVMAVEVEVEFAPLYNAQPLFRDVDAFLSDCGFTLFKLRRQEWIRRAYAESPHLTAGQLVFGDALYFKDPFGGPPSRTPIDAHRLEALILLAILYDLYDFAWELVSAPQWSNLLDVEAIRRGIAYRSRRLSSFIEALRVARATLGSRGRFKRYASAWARGDDNFYSSLY